MTEFAEIHQGRNHQDMFSNHSILGVQLNEIDWNKTAFPPPTDWPISLKTLVRTVLGSSFPMFVLWGPNLACLYNSAYTTFLEGRHPESFCQPFGDIWPELMPEIQPIIMKALAGDSSHFEDKPFDIINPKTGQSERIWVTFSYSPAYDDEGNIAGMFCVAKDTTERVRDEKRRTFQLQMADTFRGLSNPIEIMERACSLTGQFLQVSRIGYAEVHEEENRVVIVRDWTNGEVPSATGAVRSFEMYGYALIDALKADKVVCINNAHTSQNVSDELRKVVSSDIGAAVIIPLMEKDHLIAAFFVHEKYPREWSRDDVALIEDVGRRTWGAIRRAKVTEALHEETKTLQMLNHTGQALASKLELDELMQSITDNGTKLAGAQFGAFFYQGKDSHGAVMTLYNLSGAPRSAFEKFGHPRATQIFHPTFIGTGPVRSDDITKDPRYGKMAPHHGMPAGHLPVRSYLAVSVISRTGDVLGGLFFGHPDPGVFNQRTEHLIVSLASQAAIAIDNANLYDISQKSAQERQDLLARERAARSEAESMIRAKDEFLAMLAHELRNPLAPVSAAAQILKLNAHDPRRVSQVSEIISRQVGHLTHLIDDLMDVSRVTRGLIHLDRMNFDLNAIIATAVEQVSPIIESRKHVLLTQVEDKPAYVNADQTRIIQVISNLLNNAAKYTPKGGVITVSVRAKNEEVTVTVTDNGCGMDANLVSHVFELFTQGSRDLDRAQGGLGIGLALVKAIVTLHGGRVAAHSDGINHGSSFSICLPQVQNMESEIDAPAEPNRAGVTNKIMVVDDNVDAAQSLGILLTALGYEVTVMENARKALEQAHDNPPDIFILDIGLPDMTGYELARSLRTMPGFADAKMIALTGYGQPQDREMSAQAGFDHHLVKPANMQLLMNILSGAHISS